MSVHTRVITRLCAALSLVFIVLGSAAPAAHDELRFIGTVVKMSSDAHRLTMRYTENKKEETVEIGVTIKTKITRDNKAVAASELRPGAYVVVDALGCDDEYEATAIKLVPRP